MYKVASALIFLLLNSAQVNAQIFPKEGSTLNYIIIGFSFPANKDATAYKLEIASGNHTTVESFSKNIIQSADSKKNKLISQVPSFGSAYTWRVVTTPKNGTLPAGDLHHFSTGVPNSPDSPVTRLRIIKDAEKYADAYVFLNTSNTLYNMKGEPVWYLPQSDRLQYTDKSIRDIKATDKGTITFLVAGRDAYEVDYNGNILWHAPNTGAVSGDSVEHYNHELTRLSNGNYMVLGSEHAWSAPPRPQMPRNGQVPPPPGPGPRGPQQPGAQRHLNHKVVYGTIIEYDRKGNVVWSWKSSTYFPTSDIANFPNNLYQPVSDVHQNSFHFDEKNKFIYLSYKNIHQVLKLKYPEGKVVSTYGEKYQPGHTKSGTGPFCFQHAVRMSKSGLLYLFNNNSCHRECAPEIVMLQEPALATDNATPAWSFEFPVEPLNSLPGGPAMLRATGDETVGGNVMEMPDGSLFASLCAPYGNLYIVNKEKKVLWEAIVEKWKKDENKWFILFQYRASIINDHNELEKLIWNAETKK